MGFAEGDQEIVLKRKSRARKSCGRGVITYQT
jgi:hypothetical protein